MFTTALAEGEILTALTLPVAEDGEAQILQEVARRSGDYGLAGLCLVMRKAGHRIALFSVGPKPVLATGAMQELDAGDTDGAVQALASEIDPPSDTQASAAYRSPVAHATIGEIDLSEAGAVKGVLRVFTGRDLAEVCTPWVAVLAHLKGLKSPPQHPLAVGRACWVGEPGVAVVATTRAAAEEGAALVMVDYEELPVVTDTMTALDADTPVIHPDLGDNLAFCRLHEEGDVEAAMAGAHKVVSASFRTARHTGVTLEPRSILVDWNPAEGQMTAYHVTQAPHMMQTVFAEHLDIPESRVRVICGDVGGSYGIKVHVYPDEVATAAIAKLMGRPVKLIADRLES